MLNVSKIEVRSFDLDHLDLFWWIDEVYGSESGLDTDSHEIYDYDFHILRSEASMGPWEQVGGPFRDTYKFRDVSVSLLNNYRQYFYKIRVTHRVSGESAEFGPVASHQPAPDLIAAEAIRQEDLLFREFIGRRCWLFNARTFGPRCTCFSRTHGRKTRSNHGPCFGTGWLGGYLSPIECWVQFDPNGKNTQVSSLPPMQPSDAPARMISFPPVTPGDILVESENRRWRVISVNNTQRLRAVVRQELILHEIPRGDVEYLLPINVETRTLNPVADRNFTNPQSLANDDYSDIFAVFGKARGVL